MNGFSLRVVAFAGPTILLLSLLAQASAATAAVGRDVARESEDLDARVRRVLVELLVGQSTDEPDQEGGAEAEDDAALRASVQRVLQQLLDESATRRPKPIRAAEGIRVEPAETDPAGQEPGADAVSDSGEQTLPPEAEDAPSEAEQEMARTVYDEAPDLIHEVDQVTFGGFVQTSLNTFLGDHPTVGEFEIPRARLDVRGAAAEGFSYRIFWNLNRSGARLEEAWLEYSPFLIARTRVGQLKVPFSLEALYSARWIRFSERAMGPRNLAPFRDVGLNVFGRALDGRLEYAAGLFNGSFAKGNANAGSEKAVRLSWQAARLLGLPISQGVHLGVSFTHRDLNGSLAGVDYETSSGTTFFRYRGDSRQEGTLERLGFEAEWLHGPWYVAGEYMRVRREGIARSGHMADVDSQSAYIAASWIVTGEEQTRNRPVSPRRRMGDGGWGAFDVHARWDYFETDPVALDLGLADGTDRVWAVTGGVNWWPRTNLRSALEFEYSSFDDPIRIDETTIEDEWVIKLLAQFEF